MKASRVQRYEWAAIAFAATLPTAVTWVYFDALADQTPSTQQIAYTAGKILQFAFPLVWVFLVCREKLRRPRPRPEGLVVGIAFGALVMAAMLLVYFFWLKSASVFEGPAEQIRAKIAGLGLSAPWKMIALGAFYSLFHSLLEEYYWRWFVFARLRRQISLPGALILSGIAFMAHHVLLLAVYFGWSSPATYVFALSVAVGGIVWGWIYERSRSLVGPWLSHLLVDAAIFIIGYDIAF